MTAPSKAGTGGGGRDAVRVHHDDRPMVTPCTGRTSNSLDDER